MYRGVARGAIPHADSDVAPPERPRDRDRQTWVRWNGGGTEANPDDVNVSVTRTKAAYKRLGCTSALRTAGYPQQMVSAYTPTEETREPHSTGPPCQNRASHPKPASAAASSKRSIRCRTRAHSPISYTFASLRRRARHPATSVRPSPGGAAAIVAVDGTIPAFLVLGALSHYPVSPRSSFGLGELEAQRSKRPRIIVEVKHSGHGLGEQPGGLHADGGS